MSALQAKDITVAFDKVRVLEDLNVEIPTGKITALVGGNGSGKTTLLRVLSRLLKPTGGTAYLDGNAIAHLPPREIARRLGILPQSPVAPEGMTVRELVAQGRYPYQTWYRQWSEEDEEMVQKALETTHLTELAERQVEHLSGGQRQRVWIAMALAQNTPILLLDEPTTYLDLAHQVEILDLLDELNAREGRTIVMVLHDLNQACRYAHHIVVLQKGTIVASGDPCEVITEELVRGAFGIECRLIADPLTGTPLCVPSMRRTNCDNCVMRTIPPKVSVS
ncbi:iron complex transport system ATP-binding protein [Thermosporothrix hazakensis]|jgi:iron complex transport system ATP-binding protein|uniref:Iron complex transport system ATP-binding protein n=2 Tax=Thermosporothrix TaxID=768650 RepID=A0A326UCL0_THEHA|nr:ABC transporter ATP-binding protein [Thermosporothrix hazakensis]PZW32019.1 iron complex transport system ATP-binding protein [Thermosporothrix hazakensis]BBH91508.1 iron-enterobactin transporter ATP-binding protein [Thermosporothrix sp. COM3]GCE49653.1 iron-enterobactin transporter ATP-binding protein [Thermosporothrix hazakensis]